MDEIFFWLSKTFWTLLSPDSLLLVLVVLAWLALLLGWHRMASRLLTVVTLPLLVLAFLPVGEWLLLPLETRFESQPILPDEVDGIIVLGGATDPLRSAIWQQPQLNESADRVTTMLALGQRFPEAVVVFSGGTGSLAYPELREAYLMPVLINELGFAPDRFLFEAESRNTEENVRFRMDLALPELDESWVLITSAFHMSRAVGVFCAQDWPVVPWPVDHRTHPGHLLTPRLRLSDNLAALRLAIREWAAIVVYRATGRSAVLLPASGDCS
jgi:uncharacterized SAM-binding protein YcdF (DUF218 family)